MNSKKIFSEKIQTCITGLHTIPKNNTWNAYNSKWICSFGKIPEKKIYIYTWLMHLVDRLYYFIFIRETSRLGRHILVSVLFWPCLKCNWLIFKWMNGVSLPKMHQCVYYLTSNSCLLSIFFRKKEFNLPPSYN